MSKLAIESIRSAALHFPIGALGKSEKNFPVEPKFVVRVGPNDLGAYGVAVRTHYVMGCGVAALVRQTSLRLFGSTALAHVRALSVVGE